MNSSARRFAAFSVLASSLLVADGVAQDKAAQLRTHLGVPQETVIKPSLNPSLPSTTPLRVALAFGVDIEITRNFTKWVQDWNRKDAKKHGQIELVESLAQADVVLVRFLDREQSAGESTSAAVYGTDNWASGRADSEGLVPLYAYILKRNESGFEILDGYESTISIGGGSGRQLWDGLKSLIKNRPKAQ